MNRHLSFLHELIALTKVNHLTHAAAVLAWRIEDYRVNHGIVFDDRMIDGMPCRVPRLSAANRIGFCR